MTLAVMFAVFVVPRTLDPTELFELTVKSEPVRVPAESELTALFTDAETPVLSTDAETPALLTDAETPPVPTDAETLAVTGGVELPALCADVEAPALPNPTAAATLGVKPTLVAVLVVAAVFVAAVLLTEVVRLNGALLCVVPAADPVCPVDSALPPPPAGLAKPKNWLPVTAP